LGRDSGPDDEVTTYVVNAFLITIPVKKPPNERLTTLAITSKLVIYEIVTASLRLRLDTVSLVLTVTCQCPASRDREVLRRPKNVKKKRQ
jgi:hypothetical protein